MPDGKVVFGMDILKRVDAEMITAAKAKDKIRLSALRMMKAALHNRQIDLKEKFTEKEALQVFSSLAKQRKDSIEQFRNGGRIDLAEKEEQELRVIQEFMPEQMSEEEILSVIEKAIEEAGATSARDMGKVMKVLMPRLTGKADGKVVSDMVKAKLSS